MTTRLSRRDILRGDVAAQRDAVMRPPGAQPDFARLCTDCGACARSCPQKIIAKGQGGPVVDFRRGHCTFCGDCAQACPTGALAEEDVAYWPWRAVIGAGCLSLQGIACRACEDACDRRAIRFRLGTGGRAAPVLDQDLCLGCGECAYTCPSDAIGFAQAAPTLNEVPA